MEDSSFRFFLGERLTLIWYVCSRHIGEILTSAQHHLPNDAEQQTYHRTRHDNDSIVALIRRAAGKEQQAKMGILSTNV